jgi:methionyl-tRNA formyltransferase
LKKEVANKVIVFCTEGTNSNLLVNFLKSHFTVKQVYIEPHEPRKKVLKRRMKNLGFFKACGQVAFQIGILPFLSSRKRTAAILQDSNRSSSTIDDSLVTRINAINLVNIEELIAKDIPDLIFINGTGIISKEQLDKIKIPSINIHVGITPAYRGVHGGYWALREQQSDLFGITLHLVDKGIDTGNIIDQKVLQIEKKDNFKTYPLIQYLGGLDLIEDNLESIKSGNIQTKKSLTENSRLHSHPTFFGYLAGRMRHKVK